MLYAESGNLSLASLRRAGGSSTIHFAGSFANCCVFELFHKLPIFLLKQGDTLHILIFHGCQLRVHISQLLVQIENFLRVLFSLFNQCLIIIVIVLSGSLGLQA